MSCVVTDPETSEQIGDEAGARLLKSVTMAKATSALDVLAAGAAEAVLLTVDNSYKTK